MGAGASMEENPPTNSGPGPSRLPSGRSRSASARGYPNRQTSARYDSGRGRPRSAVSRQSSKVSARSLSWKDAIRSGSLQRADSRKERAAALGRKSACVIELTKSGFSYQHVQICEGQVVTFEWETDEGNGLNITQVMHDGDQYRPVIGGFNSGPVTRHGMLEQQFNMEGEYKFVSSGLRCTPLTIEVYLRKDVEATLTDEAFQPKIVRLDEGNTVEWAWKDCSVAHSITEMRYSHKIGALVQKKSEAKPVPTKTGSFRREFNKPGLYYFQSEGLHSGEVLTTIVHVRERQQEYKVEVLDRSFNPPIVVIEEGDRIWWQWDKTKCAKPHCIYQVNPPPLNHPVDESFKPVKNGFKWPQPSPSGLLSKEFFTPGVYYYSDHNFQEAAEYLGTIIVKPKQVEHFVELSPDGFTPDLLYASTGDRIWWTWAVEEVDSSFNISELEKCISPMGARLAIESADDNAQGAYMDDDLEHTKVETGLESVQMASIGVYHYRLSESPNNMSTCTVITQGGSRNHTVHVTDNGFDPKVVTIHPGDRIWWIWQDGAKPHNIIQVSHQGAQIINGFKSGATIDCPSAFMHQFRTPGVYYYIDDALAKSYGAIVVASQPQVHEIQVTANAIVHDPCVITVNDVVAWTFRGLRQHDVQQGYTIDNLTEGQHNSLAVMPRRCMNRVFTERGVFHFSSKSFLRQNTRGEDRNDELRISTVLTDEVADSAVVRLDSKGFHPNNVTIRKGQSVLWTWKESGDQVHNIVNVNPPNSDAPLSVIQGGRSFNSGKPVAKNSFLYTFDDPGEHCVASQGAPGHAGTITVLDKAVRTGTPYITSGVKNGVVQKSHVVHLMCDTDRAKIFYTLDGSAPEMHKLTSKVYNAEKGIVLKSPGIVFIRALAVREGVLNSELFTSHRFIVRGDNDEDQSSGPEEEPQDETHKQAMWHWWNCVPSIKAVLTDPGAIEVFWEHPQVESRDYIKGYNLFLNGVTYCEMFPPTYNAVHVAGLAGDRMYEIYLEVYPNDPMYLPHKSNKVVLKVPKTSVTSGALLSLETTEKPDTLAIVWMSIESDSCPIEGYRVYLNGQMCGNQVVPDANSDRCKVVIEGCQLNFLYKVMVAAVPKNGGNHKQSNELDVTLPLDKTSITLPHIESRLDDDDLYREYIEIREGSGDAGKKKRERKKSPKPVTVKVQTHVQQEPKVPEVAAVPVIGAFAGDANLPAPTVTAESLASDEVKISWYFKRSVEPLYRLTVCEVNVIGPKFKQEVNSDMSFESLQEQSGDGQALPAIQHRWNITNTGSIRVRGLWPGIDYSIYVVANYALVNAQQPYEIQAKSSSITYSTMGPPNAPHMKIMSTDLYQVTLQWEPGSAHKDVQISGFRVLIGGQQLGGVQSPNTRQSVIDNLCPGKSIKVQVQSLTSSSIGNSELSNTITVHCPIKPPPPSISQQPSYKKGTITVAWERPAGFEHAAYGEDIHFYRIYLDSVWHGEVKACAHCNRNGYQYLLTDMNPGQTYDVTVKSFAGQQKIEQMSDTVYCICESDMSHAMSVTCPAPPQSPQLRLEGMHEDGIDVTWDMPQQYGDAQISGYQMMKNGKLYGSIIPAEVHTLRIRGLSLGEKIVLQILALTDHPVGRDPADKHPNTTPHGDVPSEIFNGDRYSSCTPGPKLSIVYTGLVQMPAKVWCEQLTGHSAMIVWQSEKRARPHYVFPDNYQVTWWPRDQPDQDINSQQTKEDHLLITGLKPQTTYMVVVEARKVQKYGEMHGDTGDRANSHTFILTAKSDKITVKTASPPGAPSNIGVLATTCTSIQVGWDPPRERGAEVIGIRVDAVAVKSEQNNYKHCCVEVMADATSAVLDGLADRTEYLMVVTAITEEYFDQLPPGHEQRRSRQIPKSKPAPEDTWLPSISILASTSGTTPPTDLRIVKTSVDSVTLTWKPPHTYGSNRLQGTIVRWAEGKFTKAKEDSQLAHHRSIEAESNKVTIDGLHPGILYKVVVEAVVSVKTTLKSNIRDPEGEKMNRRTTHVMSKPVFVRTRAPCEPPKPIITGYTQNTIQLYWEKPLLYSVIGKDDSGNPKYLKLSLEGYRLEINGKPHMRLVSNAQSCTLVKCKSGKKYKIVLVALTCTEEVKKERRRKNKGGMNMSMSSDTMSQSTIGGTGGTNKEWEMTSEDLENDESASKPMDVILPRTHDGLLKEASVRYISAAGEMLNGNGHGKDEENDLGDLQLDWNIQGDASIVKHFDLTWHCHADGAVQKKVVDSNVRTCLIPVQHRRCLYDITIEADYYKSVSVKDVQKVQSIIPGSPDAPEIWTKSVTNTEFVIEWAEPRLYGIRIKGYQVYMNGKKVGNMLNSHHRKAVIPCKPRRQYKVNLIAIPNDSYYADSDMSNTLLIHTGGQSIEPSSLIMTEEVSQTIRAYDGDTDDLPVKVIRVSESSIHLDWSNYTEVENMSHYKVLWSSVAQPAEKEVKLPAGERSCILHKCYPGTNHFIRIYACALDERILDKSRQVQAQTSASPDTPTLQIRACNFKYIAIQWEQPKHYGDAAVIGYKVFVNGVVEAVLGPDQFTYTFTQGKWCKEYSFQVQAQTSHDSLNSRPSDPLVITWPGVQSPCLSKAASLSGGNAVKILWDTPDTTDNVKIKQYKLVCLDEETQRPAQIVSPIHAESTEAELQNLKHGNYIVYLEVHIHGTNDVVKSDSIQVKPALTPDPPYISVTVVGLEERRQIEKVTTCLINQRDRYLSILTNDENRKVSPGRYNEDDQVMMKAAESLAQVEERLDVCLSSLNHYTGHLLAHVSWTCAQSNPDVRVTGYKVLVDGKQYGTTLHAGVKNIRIKLGLNQTSHRLSMISVCDRPQTTSAESNAVELLTEPFLPFTYFSFLSQDPKGKGFGPSYQEALALERKQKNGRIISQGLIKKKVPPPSCTLYDIFQGAYHPLFPPSGPRHPTAILFWAKWCYSSRKTLEWFVKYARNHSSQYEFIAISCTPENMSPADRQDLVQVLTQNAWREDTCIRHMTSRSANEIILKPNKDCYWNHAHEGLKSTDMCEIFGIQGVPTLLIVHPEDYVAWKGRYCAYDYQQYEQFLDYVFAQSLRKPVPNEDPWDANINLDDLDGVSTHQPGDNSHLIHRPSSALHRQNSTSSTLVHMNGSARPQSGKKLFTKSNKKITVDMRPYSGSSINNKNPYAQKLTPSPKRGKSARKAKSTTT